MQSSTKKVIAIRGTNGSGKTTTARSLISHFSLCRKEKNISGKRMIYYSGANDKIAVLGEYDGGGYSGGCDLIRTTDDVLLFLLHLIKNNNFDLIVYEGLLMSGLVQKNIKIAQISKSYGYDFEAILLLKPLERTLEDVMARNGKKRIEPKNIVSTYYSAYSSTMALQRNKLKTRTVNPYNYPTKDLYKLIVEGTEYAEL